MPLVVASGNRSSVYALARSPSIDEGTWYKTLRRTECDS